MCCWIVGTKWEQLKSECKKKLNPTWGKKYLQNILIEKIRRTDSSKAFSRLNFLKRSHIPQKVNKNAHIYTLNKETLSSDWICEEETKNLFVKYVINSECLSWWDICVSVARNFFS